MPRVVFDRHDVQPAVEVPWIDGVAHRQVVWSTWLSRALTGDLEGRGCGGAECAAAGSQWARFVLIHEWAHYFQSRRTLDSRRWVYEGGAQAFTHMVAPIVYAELALEVDLPWGDAPWYDGWAHRLLQRRGADWILRGQFVD